MVNFLSERLEKFNRGYWTLIILLAMGVFIVYSIFFGQSLPLYLVALLFSAVGIFLYPEAGLYAIAVLTMWFERYFTLESLQIGSSLYKVYPIDFIIGLLILSIFFRWLFYRDYKLKLLKYDWLILIFCLLASFSFVYGILLRNDPSLAFGTYKNYALYAIVYLFCLILLQTKEQWQRFMFWLTIGGIGLFFFLGYGIISGEGLWSEYTPLSTLGTRLIAGTHVFYLVIFSFWVLANYFWPPKWIAEKTKWKKILFVVLLLCVLGVLVSLVRHLWLALAAMFVLWLIYLNKKQEIELIKILQKGIAVILIGSIVFFWITNLFNLEILNTQKLVTIIKQRINVENVVTMEDSSARWRVSAWTAGYNVWIGRPILGLGLGYRVIGHDGIQFFEIAMREMHNNYLGILFQLGLIGFVALVYWFLYILNKIYSIAKRFRDKGFDEENNRLFFTWGSMVILFMMIFSTSVYWDVNFFVIWWWISLAGLRFILVETKEEK